MVQLRAIQIQAQARAKKIAHFIQLDDINSFRLLSVSKKEIQSLRFESNMNILQLICFEEAVKIFDMLNRNLSHDSKVRFELGEHRDSHNGCQAIHLAAASGNRKIIDTLIEKYGANPKELTTMNQTVIHCAAQRYEGVLSIFIFDRLHKVSTKAQDSKGATALHFACVNMLIQNVQALLKLGADPNAQDIEGNSCLHLCIKQMIEIRQNLDENQDVDEE